MRYQVSSIDLLRGIIISVQDDPDVPWHHLPCVEWIRSRTVDGYGEVGVQGKVFRAHRLAYEMSRWEHIPEGLKVCHHCDTPPCVRPSHLFLGTDRDNAADCIAKGRFWFARGSEHGEAKLTEDAVREIRRLFAEGVSYRSLAQTFGVTYGQIGQVCRRTAWAHVPSEHTYRPRKLKLTEPDIVQIRKMSKEGIRNYQIASHFKVSKPLIWQILNGRAWNHIP